MKEEKEQYQCDLNRRHRNNPESGDYWCWGEEFTPVAIVIAVWETIVIYCDKLIIYEMSEVWMDREHIKSVMINEFSRWLSADGDPEKTWCDVRPKALLEAVSIGFHITIGGS